MAKREKTEFPVPNPGIYPAVLLATEDKEIEYQGETSEVVEWRWYAITQNGAVIEWTDLSSRIVSGGSKFGKRFMAITGNVDIPDSLDDEDMLKKPVWISIKEKGKVGGIRQVTPDEFTGDYKGVLAKLPGAESMVKIRATTPDSNQGTVTDETDFDDIPF